jgi:hypothetical protein
LSAQVEMEENDYHCVLNKFPKHETQIQSVAKIVEIYKKQQQQSQMEFVKSHLHQTFL